MALCDKDTCKTHFHLKKKNKKHVVEKVYCNLTMFRLFPTLFMGEENASKGENNMKTNHFINLIITLCGLILRNLENE